MQMHYRPSVPSGVHLPVLLSLYLTYLLFHPSYLFFHPFTSPTCSFIPNTSFKPSRKPFTKIGTKHSVMYLSPSIISCTVLNGLRTMLLGRMTFHVSWLPHLFRQLHCLQSWFQFCKPFQHSLSTPPMSSDIFRTFPFYFSWQFSLASLQ